jgi:hypothetical protein
MTVTSHSPVNTVMTEQPGQLLHMDTIGPSRVNTMMTAASHYSWVFFFKSNDEVFEHFQRLALRLNNEHFNYLKAIHSDNGTKFRNASFD